MSRECTEDVQDREAILYDTTIGLHGNIHLSKPIECTTPRANPNVNYGLDDKDVLL